MPSPQSHTTLHFFIFRWCLQIALEQPLSSYKQGKHIESQSPSFTALAINTYAIKTIHTKVSICPGGDCRTTAEEKKTTVLMNHQVAEMFFSRQAVNPRQAKTLEA